MNHIHKCILEGLSQSNAHHITKVDIENNGSLTTIPIECTQTSLKPDLTIFKPDKKELTISELSVPYEPNIHKTHEYKLNKYQSLTSDIENNGFTVKYFPIEIGSRGYINKDNDAKLKTIHREFSLPGPFKRFQISLSKLSIVSSFVIFHAKSEPTWCNLPLLKQ